jgi:hypothetical protein
MKHSNRCQECGKFIAAGKEFCDACLETYGDYDWEEDSCYQDTATNYKFWWEN